MFFCCLCSVLVFLVIASFYPLVSTCVATHWISLPVNVLYPLWLISQTISLTALCFAHFVSCPRFLPFYLMNQVLILNPRSTLKTVTHQIFALSQTTSHNSSWLYMNVLALQQFFKSLKPAHWMPTTILQI